MRSFLQNHPFAVDAFFNHSIVLTFAVPQEQLQSMIPACLSLDCFDGQWAFIAMAMVQTEQLRPAGFPAFLGNDFFLIGYRIFVQYVDATGKRLRGLYILKSETDKKKMEWLGNTFTQYQYTTTDIYQMQQGNTIEVKSLQSDFYVKIEENKPETGLPENSPFKDWKQARRFAGPLPFTFSYNASKREVLIVEGRREHWIPQPVNVMDYHISFLKSLPINDIALANAFIIRDIPYHWKKGRKEIWKP